MSKRQIFNKLVDKPVGVLSRDGHVNEQIQPPKGTPLFNPWTPEFIADPYPFYHRLRVTDPMMLRRLPNQRLDDVDHPDWRQTFVLRGLNKLPARW